MALGHKEESRRVRQLSLTWSLGRKTVLINKGSEVAWLREVLLVRVQIRIHVVQGGPLVTGGGGQLLLVCGVVVLWAEGGSFICGRKILQHEDGANDRIGGKREKYRQTTARDSSVQRDVQV